MDEENNTLEKRVLFLEKNYVDVKELKEEVNSLKARIHLLELLLSAHEENRVLRKNTTKDDKNEKKAKPAPACSRFRAF